MTDETQTAAPSPRGFRPGLDRAQFAIFKWLVLGHLLFLAALFALNVFPAPPISAAITPLYALPLVVMGGRSRRWRRALVGLLGFSGIQYLADVVAINSASPISAMQGAPALVPGLLGGLIGAAGSLALCLAFGLTLRTRRSLGVAALGVVALAAIGSLGVYAFLTGFANLPGEVLPQLWIFTPWQLAFAYVLAKLLR